MSSPLAFHIEQGKHSFSKAAIHTAWETLSNEDARGYLWLFEAPINTATYVIGVDPAFGLVGWDRTMKMDDQAKDNSAIEVFRLGSRKEIVKDKETGKTKEVTIPTDYQVAEFAAPVDFEATAAVVNALGRLYHGRGSMGVAHTIIEVYPGNGWMVEKTLISKYGYLNFYQPKYINTLMPQAAGKGIGWSANNKSVRDLWILGVRHIGNRGVVLRSPWLISEMETTDPIKFMQYTTEAESGFHDDRLRAMMLCMWAAHDFSAQVKVETHTTIEKGAKKPNWQASDISSDRLSDEWNRRFKEIGELP